MDQDKNINIKNSLDKEKASKKVTRELAVIIKEILLACIVIACINRFVAIHAKVPSGSMIPTIEIGDHFVVNRLTYLFKDIERQDIIVFKGYDGTMLVKRVIGLPGDIVDLIDGKVHINGQLLDESAYLSDDVETWGSGEISFPLLVPKGEYFVMGDNRTNSYDSRYFNTIKEESIVGNGKLRVYPFNKIGFIK